MDSRQKGVALVLATALVSGVSVWLNRFAVAGIAPATLASAKNLLVALALAAVALAVGRGRALRGIAPRDWGLLVLVGVLGGSIPFLLFFEGLARLAGDAAGGSLASFLHKSMFVLVAVLGAVWLREKLDGWVALGAGLALAGTAALVAPAWGGLSAAHALILGAVAFWSVEVALSRKLLRRGVAPDAVALGRMGFGALVLLAWLALRGQAASLVALDAAQGGWILLTAAFLFAYVWTFYHGLARVDAASAAGLLALGSAVSAALDVATGRLPWTAASTAGALLLVLAAAAFALRGASAPRVEGAPH